VRIAGTHIASDLGLTRFCQAAGIAARLFYWHGELDKTMSAPTQNALVPFAKIIADLVVAELEARERRLLTLREGAKYLGRSQSWLRAEIASGRIECVREGRSRPRLDRAVLDRWIDTRNGRD
jgi:excisionase family DNA binding protein